MTNSLFGNNVNEYYVALARKNFEERRKKLDAITTKEQAENYVKEVKSKIEKIFAFPERTPLLASVTGKNTFDGYSVENIIYYSRPSYPVTANLYLPSGVSGKVPGVLFLCGHAEEGKASDTYRSACVGLVNVSNTEIPPQNSDFAATTTLWVKISPCAANGWEHGVHGTA